MLRPHAGVIVKAGYFGWREAWPVCRMAIMKNENENVCIRLGNIFNILNLPHYLQIMTIVLPVPCLHWLSAVYSDLHFVKCIYCSISIDDKSLFHYLTFIVITIYCFWWSLFICLWDVDTIQWLSDTFGGITSVIHWYHSIVLSFDDISPQWPNSPLKSHSLTVVVLWWYSSVVVMQCCYYDGVMFWPALLYLHHSSQKHSAWSRYIDCWLWWCISCYEIYSEADDWLLLFCERNAYSISVSSLISTQRNPWLIWLVPLIWNSFSILTVRPLIPSSVTFYL